MEEARCFMDRLMEYPVHDTHEPLVSIPVAAEAAGVEMVFSETPIVGDLPRIFEVREGIVKPLLDAAREMLGLGWILKIEDGFRTREMQRKLAWRESSFDQIIGKSRWELGGDDPHPDLVYRRLSVLVATSPKVAGHMSGAAVDISVLDGITGKELTRGKPYLEMSEFTPMFCPLVSAEALHNRSRITAVMEKHGFATYPYEFWHYSMGDVYAEYSRHTGKPGRYAAIRRNPVSGSIEPEDDLTGPLHNEADIRKEIEKAKRRCTEVENG